MCPNILQLKYLGFLSLLKLSLDFPVSMDISLPLYIVSNLVLYLLLLYVDLYRCSTEIITIFHSLSISSTVIGEYPNIVLIISTCMFFFSKNMAYSSFVLAFMTNALNLIIKLAIYFLPYLNILIFHLASTILLLLLNFILISLTNLS